MENREQPMSATSSGPKALASKMLRFSSGMAVLAVLLWAGGRLAGVLALPIPGAIAGMVLLLILLQCFGRRLAPTMEAASMPLLKHMMLFFIPSVAGVMEQFQALRAGWLPFVIASIAGAAVTLAVTALTLKWLLKRRGIAV